MTKSGKRLRIGINGRFLSVKRTGVQRTAYNLIQNILKIDKKNEYFLFASSKDINLEEWDFSNLKIIKIKIDKGKHLLNIFWEQIKLPLLSYKYKIDVLHSPANMAPLLCSAKQVIHIHDLCFLINPGWYRRSFRLWYKFLIPKLVKKSAHIITNSNNSKNDLLSFYQPPIDSISFVYWAIEKSTPFTELIPRSEKLQKAPYLLFVGSLEPRKNINLLIRAFLKVKKVRADIPLKLLIIGSEHYPFSKMNLIIKESSSDIVFEGFVNDCKLRDYYKKAFALVYPSFYEGFGLPPLEAMALGTPVITSNISSLPEVLGDAAILVSPYKYQELVQAIIKLFDDPILYQELTQKGLALVEKFSWKKTAYQVINIYHKAYYGHFPKYNSQTVKSCEAKDKHLCTE